MEKLVIGTTNEAKVNQIRGALAPLAVEVLGVANKEKLPKVEEDGKTALENAHKKAAAYAQALGQTVLSMDNALYIAGLSQSEQPGLNVRRIPGSVGRPTDEELLSYYLGLVRNLGERVNGRWEYGICLAHPDGKLFETTIISPRIFVSSPSKKLVPGYPLESIQIEPETGKYISEMSQVEQDIFWQKAIGTQLCRFIKSTNL